MWLMPCQEVHKRWSILTIWKIRSQKLIPLWQQGKIKVCTHKNALNKTFPLVAHYAENGCWQIHIFSNSQVILEQYCRHEIIQQDAQLFKGNRFIIPTTLRRNIIQIIRTSAYQGINVCIFKVKRAYYWPGMYNDI